MIRLLGEEEVARALPALALLAGREVYVCVPCTEDSAAGTEPPGTWEPAPRGDGTRHPGR